MLRRVPEIQTQSRVTTPTRSLIENDRHLSFFSSSPSAAFRPPHYAMSGMHTGSEVKDTYEALRLRSHTAPPLAENGIGDGLADAYATLNAYPPSKHLY
jgi:hypothetical protein